MALVSVASASLTPRKQPSRFGNDLPQAKAAKLSARFGEDVAQAQAAKLSAQAPEQAAGREGPTEFVVTERTEVLLNGKPCKYQDVPGHARIVWMEVAADKKTVLRAHFRTGK
jgi:hypothetical protein